MCDYLFASEDTSVFVKLTAQAWTHFQQTDSKWNMWLVQVLGLIVNSGFV